LEVEIMAISSSVVIGFLLNLLFALIIVRFIYYPKTHNKAYVFTFLTFSTIIFFVLSFLTNIEIGVGFGLFAIFSMLRYRTDPLPIREMSYLFVIAALPVINAFGAAANAWLLLGFANIAITLILFVLEKEWGFQYEISKRITYEKIDLIKPENYPLLLADLRERTGLDIKRCAVGKVNFLRDTAEVKIYFNDIEQQGLRQLMDSEGAYANGNSADDD
jgi:hypothetical protein